jgi:hypothetical protein
MERAALRVIGLSFWKGNEWSTPILASGKGRSAISLQRKRRAVGKQRILGKGPLFTGRLLRRWRVASSYIFSRTPMSILENNKQGPHLTWLSLLFLISGFAALIYQIVWQRVLLTAFGVNIESVTVVVSVFMFGLGIGSLVGGVLSKRFATHLPLLFLLCEVVAGLFGIVSLPLMKAVSDATVQLSLLPVILITYLLLCIPTIFMGATLPILVTHLDRYYHRSARRSSGFIF